MTGPVYPDFTLDGTGSPSRYRRYESGRGCNYYTADPDLARTLDTYLDTETRRWAEELLVELGERAGGELARRADVYDAAGHELVRYDRFGSDISRLAYHPDWLTSLNEVFDFTVEMLGANGYISTFGTPRLYRDAQVNPIWEGTSNICALYLWRAISKQRGHEPVLDACEAIVAGLQTSPARHVGELAVAGGKDVREAVDGLADQPRPRQEQQVRRLADLVGDVVALAALAQEVDTDVRLRGDHRRALLAELHGRRMNQAFTRRGAVLDAFAGVPELYPLLIGEAAVSAEQYAAALAELDVSG